MALHAVRLEPAPTPVPAEPARLPATIEFRRFAGSFPTGVAVATTRDRSGQVFGTTMNALTSLSLDPPTYLMCFGTQSNTLAALHETGLFCLNFLTVKQEHLAKLFASKNPEKSFGVAFSSGANGMPVIEGVLAHSEGHVVALHAGGDHTIVVGQIDKVHVGEGEPLVFYRGEYRRLNVA
ncbi:MAG TPA: flavin reductase family protein [Burkholderiales bacterium]|nr:flavin reductase family protein [Burkholderiales bacterium]